MPRSKSPVVSRRHALRLGLGASIAAHFSLSGVSAAESANNAGPHLSVYPQTLRLGVPPPNIKPRSAWAGQSPDSDYLAPVGPIPDEPDVVFLLVHHTASPNDYRSDEVPGLLRGFFEFHTGPEKGWPDVAYNFFVDRFGEIWEGRDGSIERAVAGDATGGSQGFAQLCSLIGNQAEEPITAPQRASLVHLLAWLADRHQIDTTPGSTAVFESRGSNLWPAGSQVTTGTIAGHRDMSQTTCPGDYVYGLLGREIPMEVTALRQLSSTQPPSSANPTPPAVSGLSPRSTVQPQPGVAPTATSDPNLANNEQAGLASPGTSDDEVVWPLAFAGAIATAAAATIAYITNRKSSDTKG